MNKIILLIISFSFLASCVGEDGQWKAYLRTTETQFITEEGFDEKNDCMDWIKEELDGRTPFETPRCVNICKGEDEKNIVCNSSKPGAVKSNYYYEIDNKNRLKKEAEEKRIKDTEEAEKRRIEEEKNKGLVDGID